MIDNRTTTSPSARPAMRACASPSAEALDRVATTDSTSSTHAPPPNAAELAAYLHATYPENYPDLALLQVRIAQPPLRAVSRAAAPLPSTRHHGRQNNTELHLMNQRDVAPQGGARTSQRNGLNDASPVLDEQEWLRTLDRQGHNASRQSRMARSGNAPSSTSRRASVMGVDLIMGAPVSQSMVKRMSSVREGSLMGAREHNVGQGPVAGGAAEGNGVAYPNRVGVEGVVSAGTGDGGDGDKGSMGRGVKRGCCVIL